MNNFNFKNIQVLRAWNKMETRKTIDLCTLIREAERLGFVQKGTHDDLVNGKVWDSSYLGKCK